MKLVKVKKVLLVGLSVAMLIGTVGCSNNAGGSLNSGNIQNSANKENQHQVVSGNINAGGSTSVEKAANTVLEEFVALNPDVTFEYDATGSSTGIKNVKDGTYKLGFSSRELKDDEKEGIESKTIALDGIVLSINPSNEVKNLTLEQIKGIYTGEITNWSEVGGKDANIVVVSRENGSGTRTAFEEIVGIGDLLTQKAIIKSGNGEVVSYVAGEENAIGYISFVTLEENKDKVNGLNVDNIEPTVENVQNSSYKLSRPFIMLYDESKLNEAEKAFIEFLFTDEGQDLLEEAGTIKIK